MTFPLWPSAFVDDVSKITADFLNNYVRVPISRALDGVNGGSYTLLNNLVITGAGFVLDYMQLSGTNKVQLASRPITRFCDVGRLPFATPGDWTVVLPGRIQSTATNATSDFAVHVPHGATLTGIEIQVANPLHGGAWPPATPTRITLYRVNDTSGPTAVVGPINDSTAVQATYESRHFLSSGAISIAVDRSKEVYFLRVQGETGANALAGVDIYGTPRVTYTTTALDED